MGFKTWLREFKNEDTALGDLARDVLADKKFPRVSNSIEPAATHLTMHHACSDAKRMLLEAWDLYCRHSAVVPAPVVWEHVGDDWVEYAREVLDYQPRDDNEN